MRSRLHHDSVAARRHYVGSAALVSSRRPDSPAYRVAFRPTASVGERLTLTALVVLNAVTGLALIRWLVLPNHSPGFIGLEAAAMVWVARFGFGLVVGVEVIRLAQNFAVWVYAFNAKDPVPVDPPIGWRVAILTTIVPGKEPVEMVARTLRRMKQI